MPRTAFPLYQTYSYVNIATRRILPKCSYGGCRLLVASIDGSRPGPGLEEIAPRARVNRQLGYASASVKRQ